MHPGAAAAGTDPPRSLSMLRITATAHKLAQARLDLYLSSRLYDRSATDQYYVRAYDQYYVRVASPQVWFVEACAQRYNDCPSACPRDMLARARARIRLLKWTLKCTLPHTPLPVLLRIRRCQRA